MLLFEDIESFFFPPKASSSSSIVGRGSTAKRASSEDSEVEAKGEEAHCAPLVAQINRYKRERINTSK